MHLHLICLVKNKTEGEGKGGPPSRQERLIYRAGIVVRIALVGSGQRRDRRSRPAWSWMEHEKQVFP